MLDLKGINKVFEKLKNTAIPGEIKIQDTGRNENRYSYHFNGKMAFTFGITRGSKSKSKKFYYVPRQMLISTKEYQKLHDCPWSKEDYNKKLNDLENI